MSLRSPVRQAPLVMQVAEQFRTLIRSGSWPVGRKIPGEHQLAEELGVSRGTVREALRALSVTGLLEPRIGDGTYVRATDEITGVLVRDEVAAALTPVLDVRAGLEAAAARLAARQATPDAIRALDAALAARAAAHEARDRAGYVAADAEFHRGVVVASGNPLLLRLYDAVAGAIQQSIEDTAVFPEDPSVRDAHAAIARAIRDGDADGAVAASYGLIDGVKGTM
ncbi:FadR/GntR family transcriptional regulator [Dactylosporangium sp. CS-033363]|uniref:FadR/GntR family transcriptional regulator n=1 Tax=Dactylosporangium sp. CS-033363 TaxID=3239935 RepID=UPI003D8BF376